MIWIRSRSCTSRRSFHECKNDRSVFWVICPLLLQSLVLQRSSWFFWNWFGEAGKKAVILLRLLQYYIYNFWKKMHCTLYSSNWSKMNTFHYFASCLQDNLSCMQIITWNVSTGSPFQWPLWAPLTEREGVGRDDKLVTFQRELGHVSLSKQILDKLECHEQRQL